MNMDRDQLLNRVASKIKNLLDTNNSEEIKRIIYRNQNIPFDIHGFKSNFTRNSRGIDTDSIK